MYETRFTGTVTSKNTIITVDAQAGLCAKTTIKNDGEKLTIRSCDAGLIYTMIKLKEGDNVRGEGKSGHYAKLSSRNKPYVCQVATLNQLVTPRGVLVERQEITNNSVLYLVYKYVAENKVDPKKVIMECDDSILFKKMETVFKSLWPDKDFSAIKIDDSAARQRLAEEDRKKNKSVAQRLQEKILQSKKFSEDEDVELVSGAVVGSSSPSSSSLASSSRAFKPHSSAPRPQEDIDFESMNVG
ncbi:hypothetical protein EDC96DRAFT_581249 [Choanephora cucurbitarum]|nr:hypothetical protein EDC96DRAFT_581249 [Choanephora cucurbitarum]